MIQKFLIALLMGSVAFVANAQDTLSVNSSGKSTEEVKKQINKAKDRLVFDFTADILLNRPDSVEMKGLSRGFNVYFMYDLPLGKSRFSIAPGLGIGTSNYYFRSSLSQDSIGTTFTRISDDIDFKKSKIGLTYVDIPLEFRFRSKPNKKGSSWKLAAGFKAGLLIQNKWKYKGEDLSNNGEQVKFKVFGDDNLNRFRYGATIRGGYGMLNAFVYYSLSDLFKDNKGPSLTPLSFGISINGL